jgi:hypothetical protein
MTAKKRHEMQPAEATTAERKRHLRKERIKNDHVSRKDRKRKDLIGKKNHRDGIIIEKRNDPREMEHTKAGKPKCQVARTQVKIRDRVSRKR